MRKEQLTNLADGRARLPILTLAIIAANAIVYVLIWRDSAGFPPNVGPANIYGLIPRDLRDDLGMLQIGKMLTCNFVHVGFIHLFINMGMLYLFGRDVELAMGRIEYAMFYIGACLVSSAVHAGMVLAAFPADYANQPVVGASGAVAGVVAIYAVRYHRRVLQFFGQEIPALVVILAWLMLQLAVALLGLYRDSFLGLGLKQVSYWSHLGGFGFGLLIALGGNMALQGEREHLIAEAKRHDANGSLLDAIHRYEVLTKLDRDNAFAYAELGRLWAILEEEDQSTPHYQMAIDLYISQGCEADALARAEELKGYWPRFRLPAAMRFRFGSYLEESGQTEAALKSFRELADDEPGSVEAQMALLKIGRLQLSYRRDPKAAAETINSFLARYPASEWRRFAEEVLDRAT